MEGASGHQKYAQTPYRTRTQKAFDRIPVGQNEPKALLDQTVSNWKQQFAPETVRVLENESLSTILADFEDINIEDTVKDVQENQFGDVCDDDTTNQFSLVITDLTSPSHEDEGELGNWPRRLLHVPSLTSFEWTPRNVYGLHECPDYAAISYTWGRWMLRSTELPEVKSLPIQGVPWDVPRVDPALFTVDQFRCAIDTCTRRRKQPDLEFVWLDIACIDQNEDSREGALEIGRQAKIFHGANQTFVWLANNHLLKPKSTGDLSDQLWFLITYGPYADGLLPFASGTTENPEWMAPEYRTELIGELERNARPFTRAVEALRDITSYPWFSSLWTLQEAFLSPDSYLLDPNGHFVRDIHGVLPVLRDLLRAVRGWYEECTAMADFRKAIQCPRSIQEESLKHLAEKTGLDALSSYNPMLLYAQARHRKTTHMEDRIYGIMQVFGLSLGKSSVSCNQAETFSLSALEAQLATSLAETFPVLSQLHIHSHAVTGRQAWRLSSTSVSPGWDIELPFRLQQRHLPGLTAKLSAKEICIIDPNTGASAKRVLHGFFKGSTCAFEVLSKFWTGPRAQANNNQRDLGFEFQIALDETSLFTKESLGIPWLQWQIPRGQPQVELVNSMVQRFHEKEVHAEVLLLGAGRGSHTTFYGLIVIECHDQRLGAWWARLGICNWQVPLPLSTNLVQDPIMARRKTRHWQYSPVLTAESEDWKYQAGFFG
ncbi:hypothetical protein EJ04DRAFT_556159 [Polyplosphaeria fusca]|uniref:Heterokaryon incompatibility domain-containing protein n=1 Tax=Polyplosphaeria fusca TaxID=682080 RepID=A0A9P4QMP6_9PLEO|nr:hypothetical protein EJ04DRAFT_556159 [Polyplosphaeria fusca]